MEIDSGSVCVCVCAREKNIIKLKRRIYRVKKRKLDLFFYKNVPEKRKEKECGRYYITCV